MRGGTINAGLVPQPLRNSHGVEIHRHPPCRLIASPMEGTVMGPAERDGKLIADPAPQGAWLHEPQVMRVRRAPSAHKAGLCSNELEVRAVAVTAGFAQGEGVLIDVPGDGVVHPLFSLCGCGSRLNPNLNHSRFWRRGWHLRARPPFTETHRGTFPLGRAASFAVLSSTLARSAANSATRPGVSAGSASFASPRPAAGDEGRGASAESSLAHSARREANAASTTAASAPRRVFLAPRARCAQSVASC